jgi:hypothetical protein
MVQVPAFIKLTVVPDTVQTPVVRLEKLTVNPEVAEALAVKVVPNVLVPGLLKVIV